MNTGSVVFMNMEAHDFKFTLPINLMIPTEVVLTFRLYSKEKLTLIDY